MPPFPFQFSTYLRFKVSRGSRNFEWKRSFLNPDREKCFRIYPETRDVGVGINK